MRCTILCSLLLCACGSSSSPAAKPTHRTATAPRDVAAECNDLGSNDPTVRARATRDLTVRSGKPVEGGTEQQLEAAREFCDEETNPTPDPAATRACFAACMQKHQASGESEAAAEPECMQNCSPGE